MSTLSVRSSRTARRRISARNRGQQTPAWLVSSLTPMPCRPPVAAPCPPAPAPILAHPPGSTNKGGADVEGPRWFQVAGAGALPKKGSSLTAPLPGRSRPGCRLDTEQVFSQGQKGAALFSSICSNQASLQGEKIGLQSSSSPPLIPYLSNLTQAKGTEGSNRQARVTIQKWRVNP